MKKIHPDWRPLVKAANSAGWTVRWMKKGHNACLLIPKDKAKAPVAIPSTPGTHNRGLQNKRSELRRSGLNV